MCSKYCMTWRCFPLLLVTMTNGEFQKVEQRGRTQIHEQKFSVMMSWFHTECILQLSSYVILICLHISTYRILLVHLVQKPFEAPVKNKPPPTEHDIYNSKYCECKCCLKDLKQTKKKQHSIRILQKDN